MIAKKVKRRSVNISDEYDRGPSLPNSHQVVEFAASSEFVYGLSDSNAIPNVISDKLMKKVKIRTIPNRKAYHCC